MKNIFTIFILFIALFALTGCPVETKVSIDDGSWDYPDWVLGKWKLREGSKEVSMDNTYNLRYVEGKLGNVIAYPIDSLGHENKSGQKYLIFSRVGPQIFVSVYNEGDGEFTDPGYYLYFFNEIAPYEVELIGIKANKIDFAITRENLKAWLLNYMNDKTIYDNDNIEGFMKEN